MQIFFIISGFFAYESLHKMQIHRGGVISYYKKKILRIFPLYYTILILYMILHYFILHETIPFTIDGWLGYFAMLNQIIPNQLGGNLGATWTISHITFFLFD